MLVTLALSFYVLSGAGHKWPKRSSLSDLLGVIAFGRIYRVIRLIQVNVNGFRWLVRVSFGWANLVQRKLNMKDPVCCIFNNTCFTQTLISSQSFVVPLSFQFTDTNTAQTVYNERVLLFFYLTTKRHSHLETTK